MTGLSATDPELPLLVSRAAIELDNACRNAKQTFAATRQVAAALNAALRPDDQGRVSAWRPNMLLVWDRVFETLCKPNSIETFEEVVKKAGEFAQLLTTATETYDVLERARDFCVALSRWVAAYQSTLQR